MRLTELPDWAMVSAIDITTSRKEGRIGLLPISKTDWYEMVRQGYAPKGVNAAGRKVVWQVGVIRNIAERMAMGEFKDVRLYASKI